MEKQIEELTKEKDKSNTLLPTPIGGIVIEKKL